MTEPTDPLIDAIEAAIWASYSGAEPTTAGLVLANPRTVAAVAAKVARAQQPAVPAPATDQAALIDRIAAIRKRHAALAGRDWEAKPHQHPADGCRCLSCYDDPTGWIIDHPSALDCEERVAAEGNDFGRDRASCDAGPLLTYEEADALAHAAEDIAFLLDQAAAELRRVAAESAPGDTGHDDSETGQSLHSELKPWQLLGDVEGPLPQTERVLGGRRLDATIDPAMCPRCKGDNTEAFELCARCAAEQAAAAQQICKCPAEICQCGHHKAQQPKEAQPSPTEELLATRCDACRHSLARHHQHGACTVVLCVCGTFQYPVEELPQ